MKFRTFNFQILIMTLMIFSANNAFADKEEVKALQAARVSLAQAVNAAEQNLQGRAVKAEIELKHGKPVFEVDVIKDEKSYEAIVDAETGYVVSSKED